MNERVYIHECIPIEGGGRGQMIEMLRDAVGPARRARPRHPPRRRVGDRREHGRVARGARALGDGRLGPLRAGTSRPVPDGGTRRLSSPSSGARHSSTGAAGTRCCCDRPPSLPTSPRSWRRASSGEVILHEDVRSLPGRMSDYHAALHREYQPLAECARPASARRVRARARTEHRTEPLGAAGLGALAAR